MEKFSKPADKNGHVLLPGIRTPYDGMHSAFSIDGSKVGVHYRSTLFADLNLEIKYPQKLNATAKNRFQILNLHSKKKHFTKKIVLKKKYRCILIM